ncbi:hypothetical protein AWL63_18065 [Sphingomonas panacis]|uniref:Uncharacterized protein n=1 Tax=Sphingomonas panacis TaxID=1560345 RepID=A0A1B3ZHM2_9SPHN|nr:hypothetical protein [Sphingomonas panacis]AOH86923.1 hypothetical protein AWL63_18065 [Sphingomonas panacis]
MTYTKSYLTRIVASHEPDYWRAQATGFRLIRLLEKYIGLADLCGHLISTAQTHTERDFFRAEYDRLHQTICRIARQVSRSNGYTILRARADDSPAYRVMVQRQPVPLAVETRAAETPLFLALQQFRADAERIADAEMRATSCASYELYVCRFSGICAGYIDRLDPQIRRYAVIIASEHGYTEDEDELYPDFGPGYCSLTGIDEDCCPCGRHP